MTSSNTTGSPTKPPPLESPFSTPVVATPGNVPHALFPGTTPQSVAPPQQQQCQSPVSSSSPAGSSPVDPIPSAKGPAPKSSRRPQLQSLTSGTTSPVPAEEQQEAQPDPAIPVHQDITVEPPDDDDEWEARPPAASSVGTQHLLPPVSDRRPGSAPAVLTPTQQQGGCFSLAGTGHHDVDMTFLSTPIQGKLDFSFPTNAKSPVAPRPRSSAAATLESELRHDAEVRSASRSPARNANMEGATGTSAPVGVWVPGASTSKEAEPAWSSEEMAKLQTQQEALASQMKALQMQEMKMAERQQQQAQHPQPRQDAAHPTPSALPHAQLDGSGIPASVDNSVLVQQMQQLSNMGGMAQLMSRLVPMGINVPGGYDQASVQVQQSLPSPAPQATQSSPTPVQPQQQRTAAAGSGVPSQFDFNSVHAPAGHRLDALRGQIGTVARDQHGCRFLQKLCEEGNPREVTMVFEEVFHMTGELMVDPFGNYLMQKICEHCSEQQRTRLVGKVANEIPHVTFNMHGTRAVQKVIEQLKTPEQIRIFVEAMAPHTVAMIKDLNGNHVIQRCLQKFGDDDKQFVYDAISRNVCEVATHKHGCCVLQRSFDYGNEAQKLQLIREVAKHCLLLVQDPFGNYVIQYVLQMEKPDVIEALTGSFLGHLAKLCVNKFSSNVVELCIKLCYDKLAPMRTKIIMELCSTPELPHLLKDQYANYVIQTALNNCSQEQLQMMSQAIRPHLHLIKNTPHGKKIEGKLKRSAGGAVAGAKDGGKGRKGGRGRDREPKDKDRDDESSSSPAPASSRAGGVKVPDGPLGQWFDPTTAYLQLQQQQQQSLLQQWPQQQQPQQQQQQQ
eukprot:Sspe_Gene.5678::Locus_1886_Transcript_1_1_Confidence_1.000_Length_2530::g.5678::m.5678